MSEERVPARSSQNLPVEFPGDGNGANSIPGKLPIFEVCFRLGLLLGAALFFQEAFGSPISRGLSGLAGFFLSALIVSTMALKWRVLGDWRESSQQVLYLALIITLTFPISAALFPTWENSAIPDSLENSLHEMVGFFEAIPGVRLIMGFFKAFVAFIFLIVTLGILVMGSAAKQKGGIIFVAVLLIGICLFFYPCAELAAGFALLGFFFYSEWETPILISEKIRRHLAPTQLEFLLYLLKEQTVSTGETKLYLDNNPHYFAELLDFRLVEYDNFTREVLPGRRLLHDPGSAALETAFSVARRSIWIFMGIIYLIMPDFIPGPLDDMLVLILSAGGGFSFFGLFGNAKKDRGER
ncbi:hypothetical protein BH09SUM1_BH09SUM1_07590 [soil metagenome]